MDNLTHGLLGLALGALRRPDKPAVGIASPTDKAVLLGCALAAELPDLDNLLPAANPVLHALQAHRGLSHAVLLAPAWALLAAALAKLWFRQARVLPVAGWSLLAVWTGHLLPDVWTGWGTRVWLPFSSERWSLDWTMVVDPLLTLPLLVAAGMAWRQPSSARRALGWGLAAVAAYLGLRVGVCQHLQARVRRAHPEAMAVTVFPAWSGPLTWRYVVTYPQSFVPGEVGLGRDEVEYPPVPRTFPEALPAGVLELPTVAEALAWARFPVVRHQAEGEPQRIRIADLRYHLKGEPTLAFELLLDSDGQVRSARLERGGSASELLERWMSRSER